MKYLIVTDTPAPWREKVYEHVYKKYGNEFSVVYCNFNEKRRLWKFTLGNYPRTFLKGLTIGGKGKERFISLRIIPFILRNKPKIVIWYSFQPTVILALIILKIMKAKLAILSDAWIGRDKNISWIQKIGRKFAYTHCGDAFIGASKQTLNMYRFYNKQIHPQSLFLSHLCADNDYFKKCLNAKYSNRKYDIMFSGRIVELKNPLFFADVAVNIKKKIGKCSVLIIGDGDEQLKKKMFEIFQESGIDYSFEGFIEHSKLPEYYSQAKLLLLPTSMDCWGVVINEAFVSGVPVITTDMTAAAGELVLDGENGYVLPMEAELWAEKISGLLKSDDELEEFSKCARETVSKFNFEKAAQGIIDAIEYLKVIGKFKKEA